MVMDPLVILVENYFWKDIRTEADQKDLRKNIDGEPKNHFIEI